jgi:transposase
MIRGRIGGMPRQQAQLLWFFLAGYTRYDFADYFCLTNQNVNVLAYRLKRRGWTVDKAKTVGGQLWRRPQVAALYEKLKHEHGWGGIIAQRLGISKDTVYSLVSKHKRANV